MATSETPPVPSYPNLRPRAPWQKGESGNPRGRPPYRPISDALKKYVNQPMARELVKKLHLDKLFGTEDITWGEVIAMRQMLKSLKDLRAAEFVRDSIEGRPTQRIELGPAVGEVQRPADFSSMTDSEMRDMLRLAKEREDLMKRISARQRQAK